VEFNIPLPRQLFKAIERTIQLADPVGMMWILKSWGLFHEHFVVKVPVKEVSGEIHMATFPAPGG
jgi:hypothetical protein